jgi:hypothetical protein
MYHRLLSLVLLLAGTIPGPGYAQTQHTNGITMVGVQVGFGEHSKTIGIACHRYLSNSIGLRLKGNYDRISFPISTFHSWNLQPELGYTLLSDQRLFYVNAAAGLMVGLEYASNDIFPNRVNNHFTGESVGLSCELFLSTNLKLEASFEQRFLQNSLLANYRCIISIGAFITL